MARRLVLTVLAGMAWASSAGADAGRLSLAEVPVAAMKSVAPESYAAASDLAAGGATPVEIALKTAGPFEGRTQLIIQENRGGERPSAATVTVIRAGFLDDAVWGDRWEVSLSRAASGSWAISEVKLAWGCRRGRQVNQFGTAPCP